MDILYFEEGGKLHFSYAEEVFFPPKGRLHKGASRVYGLDGVVPDSVVKKGDEAVRKYVEKRIKRAVAKQKAGDAKFDRQREAFNAVVSVRYKDVTLQGRIYSSEEEGHLFVKLESPIEAGPRFFSYAHGFGAAMMGRKVWEDRHSEELRLAPEAVEWTKNELIEMYRENQPGDVLAIAKQLNAMRKEKG